MTRYVAEGREGVRHSSSKSRRGRGHQRNWKGGGSKGTSREAKLGFMLINNCHSGSGDPFTVSTRMGRVGMITT